MNQKISFKIFIITLTILFTASIFLLLTNSSLAQEEQIGTGKKVLFVWGGWRGHEPEQCKDIFIPWLRENGFEVIVDTTLEPYTNKELMKSLDLIIQIFTMSKITGAQEKGLLDAIKNGVNIAGWHGGLGDAFRMNTNYQFMVGGQWVAHPGGVIDYEVNIINHDEFQIREKRRPFGMIGQHGRMQHVRVRQHQIRFAANSLPLRRRRVAVIHPRPHRRAQVRVVRHQLQQPLQLILRERLSRK